ncbi:MAG TPA: SymE family type I addiction module toxin [Bacteroidia bacterium]|jgi:toxic protein SymE|nr:SymE family type I addiction module toxin [Bacteroidia bacterium]
MANNKKRNLKVYGKYVRQFNGAKLKPEIRLTGKWLEKWGFKTGNLISVSNVDNGVIIVRTTNHQPVIHL